MSSSTMTAISEAVQIGEYKVCPMGPFEKLTLTPGELEYGCPTYHYGRGQKRKEFVWRDVQEPPKMRRKMIKADVWECRGMIALGCQNTYLLTRWTHAAPGETSETVVEQWKKVEDSFKPVVTP